jgi:hypothetical protein
MNFRLCEKQVGNPTSTKSQLKKCASS